MIRDSILLDVSLERNRQEYLCASGKFEATLAAGVLSPEASLTVLAEEFGEVAMIVSDYLAHPRRAGALDTEHLREELVQLAACCVAWCEALDRGGAAAPPDSAPVVTITCETDMGPPPSWGLQVLA